MSILLTILSILAALVVLALIVALVLPKEYAIYRQVTIDRPREAVFDYVRMLKNQDHWSKWVMKDPAMEKAFRGTDGKVGFVYGWNSKTDAGEGEQEIIGLTGNERLDVEIRFKRPMAMTAQTPMELSDGGTGKTRVRWGMTGRSPFPMNLMTAILSSALGKDIEISLGNLKSILEKR